MPHVVAVNGRFLTQSATGVQRYAREALRHLPDDIAPSVRVLHPDGQTYGVEDLSHLGGGDPPMSGARGYLWEQTTLPARASSIRASVLVGLANCGALLGPRQVVVVHDIGPLLHPEFFDPRYVTAARTMLALVKRRARRIVTVSERSRQDLVEVLQVPRDRVDVVPPGASAPSEGDDEAVGGMTSAYCLFVGGHDRRKNVDFLLRLWGSVYDATGLRLVITYRANTPVLRSIQMRDQRGVSWIADPADDELGRLYQGASCLLWPSLYEGFGMPLLEAMAHGTPFLSAPTGAAPELAVEAKQIVPLERDLWVMRLRELSEGAGGLQRRQVQRQRAEDYSWPLTGALLAASIGRALG